MPYAVYCAATLGVARDTTLYLESMQLIDIHTHTAQEGASVFNSTADSTTAGICSIGIHPWDIDDCWKEHIAAIEKRATEANVVAIGECGFDFLRATAAADTQRAVFEAHARISEHNGKPLIIHIVKGAEQLLKAAKEIPHKQAWIIHGFRGKEEQATQLLRAGFYLSFGEKFNSDTVKSVPLERIFIESDESNKPIASIYENIAHIKGISINELATAIKENAIRCNINLPA